MSVRLPVVTANIGRGVTAPVAARNIALVMRAWPAGSIGWQEIDEADAPNEHQLLHAYLSKVSRVVVPQSLTHEPPAGSLRAVGWATTDPLFVPPGWRILERHINQTCEGRAGLTPARFCVQVLIEHLETGLRLVRKNGHYPREIPELADLWDQCQATWTEISRNWRDLGYTQVDTRDTNRKRRTLLLRGERLLLGAGLDKITYIPGSTQRGVRLRHAAPGRRVPLSIDGHDALGLTLTIHPPKEP